MTAIGLGLLGYAAYTIKPWVDAIIVPKYRFGVEIEIIAKPTSWCQKLTRPLRSSESFREKLVKKLHGLGEAAQLGWPSGGYEKWYITTDASLGRHTMKHGE